MTKDTLYKRNLMAGGLLLVIALGPLAAFTLGNRFADEETLLRAEAGDRNYEQPGRYPDRFFGLPELVGAAAGTTVLDVTRGDALFEQFNHALREADFRDVLRGPGPLTVFVPTDEAFRKLPEQQRRQLFDNKEKLVQLLSNHVVRDRLAFTDLRVRDQVETIGGETVPITFGGSELGFGSADVIKPNLVAGNGVVHIVDSLNL